MRSNQVLTHKTNTESHIYIWRKRRKKQTLQRERKKGGGLNEWRKQRETLDRADEEKGRIRIFGHRSKTIGEMLFFVRLDFRLTAYNNLKETPFVLVRFRLFCICLIWSVYVQCLQSLTRFKLFNYPCGCILVVFLYFSFPFLYFNFDIVLF